MNIIPIVFAFDNNLAMPAAVCIYSLFRHANKDTKYHVIILHSDAIELNKEYITKVSDKYPLHTIEYLAVSDSIFGNAFEIRGITNLTYYRLLIPQLISDYDKVIYSDVDVIFRKDLSEIYSLNLDDSFFGGVKALANIDPYLNSYYSKTLKLDPKNIIYAGNLMINSAILREDESIISDFIRLSRDKLKYQDLDIINLRCAGRIKYLPPEFCLSTYISRAIALNDPAISEIWSDEEIIEAMSHGIIHYNGQKPWRDVCINFDVWWEYYRQSPIFDPKWYYEFFYRRLTALDRLPLWKRVKLLARYFIHGQLND